MINIVKKYFGEYKLSQISTIHTIFAIVITNRHIYFFHLKKQFITKVARIGKVITRSTCLSCH